ncbi:MAG: alpha/beta hydrolase [Planctomycetes bacterium]|nr:alpha/beta hydrolase [Planctomycetota bacterium]
MERNRHRSSLRVAVLALPLLLPACVTSAYRQLRPEDELGDYGPLHRSFLARKREMRLIPTTDREGRLVKIAVHEVGEGDRAHAVVFIHGVLSDHEAFRYIAGAFRPENDLLLVELPGCGDSDKPDPGDLGPGGYGATAMGERVLQALRAVLEARPRPTRVTLVGHSLGGTIALRMMTDPALRTDYADVLARVDRLALLAPIDVAIEKQHATFQLLEGTWGITVWLADLTGILRHRAALSSAQSTGSPWIFPREEVDRLVRNVRDGQRRRAAQAMVEEAVPRLDDSHPDWRRIEALTARYATIRVPTLILWGAWDETFPLSMGFKLQEEIPGAVLRILPETKHSLQMERPRLCARLIEEFIREEGLDGPRVARVSPEAYDKPVRSPIAEGAR